MTQLNANPKISRLEELENTVARLADENRFLLAQMRGKLHR